MTDSGKLMEPEPIARKIEASSVSTTPIVDSKAGDHVHHELEGTSRVPSTDLFEAEPQNLQSKKTTVQPNSPPRVSMEWPSIVPQAAENRSINEYNPSKQSKYIKFEK